MTIRPWGRPAAIPVLACALVLICCGARQPAMLGVGLALLGLAAGIAPQRGWR
ncbi:hypothetical protein [Stenotrophomonas sp. MMGLT7]|uniref:hypothetical protein n=1 Tax=Stenotrophomonas sp. MMGLT7 TaxID=2901227 RepID=UPI001E46CE3B|nr:hypothetical protein [Stenotrophomonas sp. MMGLT7]MCD7099049.1 hypothetical protein [Stenotrophomonas sp. MMGLT7]